MLTRSPGPALRPYVDTLWATDLKAELIPEARRELVLPTGSMHLAIRIAETPVRIFDAVDAAVGREVGHAVIGGACAGYFVRDVSQPAASVGAMLRPGAAPLLLGAPADALSGRHTALEDLWGSAAAPVRERLAQMKTADERLDYFEAVLVTRLPRLRAIHPAVAEALECFRESSDVRRVVERTGYSHRRFIELFREAVGLTPKLYCRVLRFHRVIERASADDAASWAELALSAGYADQAHFNHDFREFAGVTPGRYRELSPARSHHVPLRFAGLRPLQKMALNKNAIPISATVQTSVRR